MVRTIQQAIAEMKGNAIIHGISVLMIALTVFLFSSLFLCWDLVQQWFSDTRGKMPVMVYLKEEHPAMEEMARRIAERFPGNSLRLIPKDEALSRLQESLRKEAGDTGGFLDGFETNPLPDTIELQPGTGRLSSEAIASMVKTIESMEGVERVSYPELWLEKFHMAFRLVRLMALSLCGAMMVSSVMIVSSTARLALGTRREEIAILRLLGATDSFIAAPICLQGVLQGVLGGGIGLLALWIGYRQLSMSMPGNWDMGMLSLHFISWAVAASIWAGAILAGTLGCIVATYSFLRV